MNVQNSKWREEKRYECIIDTFWFLRVLLNDEDKLAVVLFHGRHLPESKYDEYGVKGNSVSLERGFHLREIEGRLCTELLLGRPPVKGDMDTRKRYHIVNQENVFRYMYP